MNVETLNKVVALAQSLRHIFIATADTDGLPHIAAAGGIAINPGGLLAVTSWFCPATVINLKKNKRISLVVWDAKSDTGFQLLGNLQDMQEVGILDGYDPEIESKAPIPQVHRQLLVRVEKIIEFKHAPHSDIEE